MKLSWCYTYDEQADNRCDGAVPVVFDADQAILIFQSSLKFTKVACIDLPTKRSRLCTNEIESIEFYSGV